MIPCVSQATLLGTPFEESLAACAHAGWTAIELWLTALEQFLESHPPEEARRRFDDLGVRPLAAAAQGGLLLSQGPAHAAHWDHFARRLELLEALQVPVLVVHADHDRDVHPEDYGRACESLAEAGGLAARHGVTLALECQKSSGFCASLDTTLALIAQSGAVRVGACLDLFQYYCGPSKFEDLALLGPDHLAWVQLCDLSGVPRECATDADRVLPGEGDFHIGPVLDELQRIGYRGGVSVEVLNPRIWKAPPGLVAETALRALERTLGPGRMARSASGGP